MSKRNKPRKLGLRISELRILELIQSYGANLKRWPQAERQAGKAWLDDNPALAQKLLKEASALDQALNTLSQPVGDTTLLQARILKASKNTAQDGASHAVTANDAVPSVFSAWKAVAATLVLATGMGFGIGQLAAADTSYASAEALLSISMQSDYVEADLYGDWS